MLITRRQLLRTSAVALLARGLWPGTLAAADTASKDFSFVVVNDLHYLDKGCGEWLTGILRGMKERPEKIAFCLLAGDLVEHGKPEQLNVVRDLLKACGFPCHVVIGNHDYLKQDDRKAYEEAFPERLNYAFDHEGWQFVGLDTSEGLHWKGTKVQPATLRWLDDALPKLDRRKPLVVLTHFPMGPTVNNRPSNADEVIERLKPFDLRAVFCGHYHAFTERTVGTTILTTNRCCSLRSKNHDGSKEKG